MSFYLGLDLGQSQDFTALAVVERTKPEGKLTAGYVVRHLQRWPLKTSYPRIVDDVADMLTKEPALNGSTLCIDATGVGRAVVDLFRTVRIPAHRVAITITGGHSFSADDSGWCVPKKDLVGAVIVLLEAGRLKVVPSLAEAQTLVRELQGFRMKITAAANETFSAREGLHDDLVLAVAMPLWYCDRAVEPTFLVTSMDGRVLGPPVSAPAPDYVGILHLPTFDCWVATVEVNGKPALVRELKTPSDAAYLVNLSARRAGRREPNEIPEGAIEPARLKELEAMLPK